MSQMICDEPPFEDRAIERVRPWRKLNRALTPLPPKRWLHVVTLPEKPDGLSIGAWICALWELHRHLANKLFGPGFHMIARDEDGDRYLLVHPKLKVFAETLVEDINERMTGCNCGGSDCLAGAEQYRALQVRGRRVWNALSPAKRMDAVKDYDGERISVAVALSPLYFQNSRDDPESPFEVWFLEHLTGAR
jgi:hypothetical protein